MKGVLGSNTLGCLGIYKGNCTQSPGLGAKTNNPLGRGASRVILVLPSSVSLFGYITLHVGSYFPNQGLNLGPCSGSAES